MNDYGLAVNSASGNIMFDSRRQMSSYVLYDYGSGTGVTTQGDDLVFVKGSAAVQSLIIYAKTVLSSPTSSYEFRGYNPSTGADSLVTLDYLHIVKSADVSPDVGDDFGLMVLNPDGTVQFDSRSLKSDTHFSITDYHARQSLAGNASIGPNLVTTTAEYVEITKNSEVTMFGGLRVIEGVQWVGGNTPKYWNYAEQTPIGLPTVTTYSTNQKPLFIAELDV